MNDDLMPTPIGDMTPIPIGTDYGGYSAEDLEPSPMREVTPPSPTITFDENADYPQGPPLMPPPRAEYEPHACDALKQRVYDTSTNEFYKATCLVLEDRAYWLQNQVRKAMFGTVWIGHLLQRPNMMDETLWQTTGQIVAIKEVSRQMMAQARACGSAEDPCKEHAAMQHVFSLVGRLEANPAQAMTRSGVMMPQDWLQDEHYCYLVMPYCNGGELFDRVGHLGRFSEEEARHWMHQILNSLETLHTAGLCHRDLSLENVMIHNDRAVIIDMGMSLNVPYDNAHQRRLIAPQGQCGKMKYMAPEVYLNQEFDGFAVDMWAVGVIMYIMLTGEVPWQFPHMTDLKFAKLTDGWIEPYLKGQGFPLSANAHCLLQRMLWLNPQDRLCLQQVRAHPWMMTGAIASPQQGLIRWRSANRGNDAEEEDADDERDEAPHPKIIPPCKLQRGKYSKEESVSDADMTIMQETVQKYQRDELRPEEEIATVEPTVLSEDDDYVKALRAKMMAAQNKTAIIEAE